MSDLSLSPPRSRIHGPARTALTLSRTLSRLDSKISALDHAFLASEYLPERYELRKLFTNLNHAGVLLHQLETELNQGKHEDGQMMRGFMVNTAVVTNFLTRGQNAVDHEKTARLREDCVRWKGELREVEGRLVEMEIKRRDMSGSSESEQEESGYKEEETLDESDTELSPIQSGKLEESQPITERAGKDIQEAATQQLNAASELPSEGIEENAPMSPALSMPLLTITPTGLLPMLSPALQSPGLRHRFGPHTPKTPPTTSVNIEVVLDHVRQEQDNITNELLQMAKQLKASSIGFNKDLEDEKPLLETATTGLGGNLLGIEATGGKIRALQRDKNVGFVRRMVYLAVAVVLMFAIFLVFTLPKIR